MALSTSEYRNQKQNEYRLLLNMHSAPLPTLVSQEELAQAEVIDKELNAEVSSSKPQKFSTREAQYEEMLRRNAELTNERNSLEEELEAYKTTIQAQQLEIKQLQQSQKEKADMFKQENIRSESNELLDLRQQLEYKLDILATSKMEHERMLEQQIREDFTVELEAINSDCEELKKQRDTLVNNPEEKAVITQEKEYLQERASELMDTNFKLKERNSTLEAEISEYSLELNELSVKLAECQRKLADLESKNELYEEILEVQSMQETDVPKEEKVKEEEEGSLTRQSSVVQITSRARQLEIENQRLEKELQFAHKMTLNAEQKRLEMLQTPEPVKQMLLDILEEINIEITCNTIHRSEKIQKLNESMKLMSLEDSTGSYIKLNELEANSEAESLKELQEGQKEKLLLKLLENKRIVEMTISALDVEQSLLLSDNTDVLNWIKTGIIE